MADPKLTPALPRAQVKTPQLQKPAAKPAPPTPEPHAAGLSQKQKARIGGADYLTTSQPALALTEKLTPPSTARMPLDAGGRMLLASTSQTNTVSQGLKNSNDICGGAAMVSALILRSTTPDAAKANARAFRAAFNASPMKALTSVDVQSHVSAALKNFEEGALSEEDVCYLQQAAYAIGRGTPGEPQEPGLSNHAMASMVADLIGYGANFGKETSFTQAYRGGGHWVGESGGVSINTAFVRTPAAEVEFKTLTPDSPEFSGRVRVLESKSGARTVQWQSSMVKDAKTRAFVRCEPKGSGWQAETSPLNPADVVSGLLGSNARRLEASLQKVPSLGK